jgi:Kef-type K+ transport system membrane component KefB
MEQVWFTAMVWLGLALIASLRSVRSGISVALVEIFMGVLGGNILHLQPTEWIQVLAAFGSVVLTFLAGAEVDPNVLKKQWKQSLSIGFMSFLVPFVGAMAYAYYVAGWSLPASQIAGLALSTTSVAVIYAVLVERGYNETALGKLLLAACFITDLGTVLVLGFLFADYDRWLLLFIVVTGAALWLIPRLTPWFFSKAGSHISEPETKYLLILLCGLGAFSVRAGSEAVLPAYLVGMVLAPIFLANKTLAHRLRMMAFTILTPFFFLKAGVMMNIPAMAEGGGLIFVFLMVKLAAKFLGVWPLTRYFRMGHRSGMYTTLLMSTGLTFGTISSLYGLSHQVIDQAQYTVLVTAVILSAIVPTVIAERWYGGPHP